MSFNAFPYVVSWAALACVVLGMAAYKLVLYSLSSRDEFAPHINSPRLRMADRSGAARWEDRIDRWGKILTVVVIGYGLAISALYFYSALTTYSGR